MLYGSGTKELLVIRLIPRAGRLLIGPVILGSDAQSFCTAHSTDTMTDASDPSPAQKFKEPVVAEEDADSDDDVFHDARFPADEEAVS